MNKVVLLACGLLLAISSSAVAYRLPPGQRGASEAQIRTAGELILGREHAAEHAAEWAAKKRAVRRFGQMSPVRRKRIARRDDVQAEQFAAATTIAPASSVGRWTQAPFNLPHAAVNAAMLPTGKVMFWGLPFPNQPVNQGNAALWDPSKGYGSSAFTEVPPPRIDPDGFGPQPKDFAPLFCSGLSFLATGEVLATGGNLVFPDQYTDDAYTAFAGLNRVFTFNPWTQTWTEQPRMNHGRWYPGQVELADGRSLTLSGYTEEAPGGKTDRDLELYTPAAQPGGVGSVTLLPSGSRFTGLYPHLFVLPNKNVLLAGPYRGDSAVLRTSDFTWQNYGLMSRGRVGGNAILMPAGPGQGSWRVTEIGGYDRNITNPQGDHLATNTSETLNANPQAPSHAWKPGASMILRRSYQNTVLLPDGSMVAVGGGIGDTVADNKYAVDPNGRQRQVELYDPATNQWRLGPAQVEDRGYHSTALLLPSGKVWSAGDNKHPTEPDGGFALTDTAEIYSPPYLYKGTRPSIVSAPSRVTWKQNFSVGIDATKVSADAAVLVAPGATTHGDEASQRMVRLVVRGSTSNRIDLTAPASSGIAPPGYYMLFVLHQGVPSVAKWVKVG